MPETPRDPSPKKGPAQENSVFRSRGELETRIQRGQDQEALSSGDVAAFQRVLPERYQIVKELGYGGWGQVYLARDVGETGKGSREVAIKLIRSDLSERQEIYERFAQEMHIAEKFDHPNIVQVLTHGKTAQGMLYLVMQYVEGGSLLDWLYKSPSGRLTDSEVIDLGLQICSALMVAHDLEVIHRDIKPGNILMREERYPRNRLIAKLSDFGLARSLDESRASQSVSVGTFGYRSPEQRSGKGADRRSDIYSLGATLYHAASGDTPEGIVDWDELPSALRQLLRRAMSKRPEDRYSTAQEFYEALEQCQSLQRTTQAVWSAESHMNEPANPAPPDELMSSWLVDSNSRVINPRKDLSISNTSLGTQPRIHVPELLPPQRESRLARVPLPDTITNSIGIKFRLIHPGTFLMGSPLSESGRDSDETQHSVTISEPYYFGVYEVTQEEYKQVMGTNPSCFKSPRNPVERVSWEDARVFIAKMNALSSEKSAGRVYRLPTEAEWEYACRAGSATSYSFGDDVSRLGEYAWYLGNSGGKTHPVGEKEPNEWGLYDMHGNVWEWCQDWYGRYPTGSVVDPAGPARGSARVLRGGSWYFDAANCESASRNRNNPLHRDGRNGFRVALVPLQ